MTITVLMSVYKSEKAAFLDRAIHSIWTDQTLKPQEIVLIQDGPLGEELLDVIRKWKMHLGEKLILHKNTQNQGLTKSLNMGLGYVSSELIARMDSDDISHPLRFERQANFMKEHLDIAVVGGALQEFNDENECLNIRRYPSVSDQVEKYIAKASPLAHPSVMIRSSLFANGIRYDERFRTSQDIALWFDILVAGYKISNLNEVVIYFRRDDTVYERRSKDKAINEFKIYMSGIKRLYGVCSFRYIYPFVRLIFRLMPTYVVKWVYGSKLRNGVLQ